MTDLSIDVAYLAAALLGDAVRIATGGILAASFLYSIIIVTVFVIRNE